MIRMMELANKEDCKEFLDHWFMDGFNVLASLMPDLYNSFMNVLLGPPEIHKGETLQHAVRVGYLSGLIAEALALPEDFVRKLRTAAPLHDIGKVAIPDHILLKPAKLNLMEWCIMTNHTTRGWEYLDESPSEILHFASRISLYHHERWDGYGYPSGLGQGSIPLEGQIVALADSFDAIVSSKPYRKAFAFFDGIEEIRKQKGRQFAPLMVHAFLSREEEIKVLYRGELRDHFPLESNESIENWD